MEVFWLIGYHESRVRANGWWSISGCVLSEVHVVKNLYKGDDMRVVKVKNPITAFEFIATSDGNNLNALSVEVSDAGGTVRSASDTIAQIQLKGRTYDLPIGYALVFDGGVRLLSSKQFHTEYAPFAQVDLADRVGKLEKLVYGLTVGNGDKSVGTKSKPRKAAVE